MSAIEAASVRITTLADGTLRITADIEPRHAQAAFALFGSPGTPMALAALKVGHAAITSESAEEVKPKGGALAKLAGMWCADPHFIAWLTEVGDFALPLTTDDASEVVRVWCGVASRADLDHDARAADAFQTLIRGPYMKRMQEAA